MRFLEIKIPRRVFVERVFPVSRRRHEFVVVVHVRWIVEKTRAKVSAATFLNSSSFSVRQRHFYTALVIFMTSQIAIANVIDLDKALSDLTDQEQNNKLAV